MNGPVNEGPGVFVSKLARCQVVRFPAVNLPVSILSGGLMQTLGCDVNQWSGQTHSGHNQREESVKTVSLKISVITVKCDQLRRYDRGLKSGKLGYLAFFRHFYKYPRKLCG